MPAPHLDLLEKTKRILSAVVGRASPNLAEPEIDRHVVSSNSISTLGYDSAQEFLQVEYFNGHVYRFDAVSPQAYQRLMDADDFDRAFRSVIFVHHRSTKIGRVPSLNC